MVKIDSEVDYDYGWFVDFKILKITESSKLHKDYVPYKKEVVYYEYEKDKQKIKDDYKKQILKYEKDIEFWRKEYVLQGCKHAHKSKWFGSPFELRINRQGLDNGRLDPPFGETISYEDSIRHATKINWEKNIIYLDKKYPNWRAEAIDIIGPQPQEPEKPSDYPKGRPRIKKTRRYKLTQEDKYYDLYLDKKRKHQTEANCPICNALIRFDEVRKPPFEDKCEICEYSFTFIYKEITEWYKNAYDKRCYIPYDGIKPTRPRAPSKGDYVSDGKRKPIPQDVKDKVWNRDNGKCIQCGSNENLEFDHIIPLSKGGANTYRNIQLLCESCNRSKSDNIG